MANTKISDLAAGAAVTATDIVPNVQVVGAGPVKSTLLQIANYILGTVNLVLSVANRPEFRNGANSQTFRVYHSYTDESNFDCIQLVGNGTTNRIEALGAGTGGSPNLGFGCQGATRWFISDFDAAFKPAADASFDIGTSALQVANFYVVTIKLPGTTTPIFTTRAAITSGAGSGAGTLTNAPAAGNPTAWIPISDNGTTRYIPAW